MDLKRRIPVIAFSIVLTSCATSNRATYTGVSVEGGGVSISSVKLTKPNHCKVASCDSNIKVSNCTVARTPSCDLEYDFVIVVQRGNKPKIHFKIAGPTGIKSIKFVDASGSGIPDCTSESGSSGHFVCDDTNGNPGVWEYIITLENGATLDPFVVND